MQEYDYIKQNEIFTTKIISEGDTIYYFKEGRIFNFIVLRVVYESKTHSLREISCKVPIFSRHFKPYTHFETQTYFIRDRKRWDAFFTSKEEADAFNLKYHQNNIEKQKLIINDAKEELEYSLEVVNKFKN
jgi:hypothetical protein